MAHAAATLDTDTSILDAARSRLLADGYAGLSTRKVAEEAGVPVSQLIQDRLWPTLLLVGTSTVLAMVFGVWIGIIGYALNVLLTLAKGRLFGRAALSGDSP